MIDAKLIRNEPEKVRKALESRNADPSLLASFIEADEEWRKKLAVLESMKSGQNQVSEQIAKLKKEKQDASALLKEMKELAGQIKELASEVSVLEAKANDLLLYIPNMPSEKTPSGKDDTYNVEVRRWGTIPKFDFPIKPHDQIGEQLGILDFKQGAKLSGGRFVVCHGLGARLEMALINFMLDLHTSSGYSQVMTPFMVNAACMQGTGQLPKFEEDLYKTSDDMYLIPTAEVSVTNLHREDILPVSDLPIKYVAYSPCFRREAGSYGKDVKGIIRQHQFNKVELVKFCLPEDSYNELEALTLDAERVLQELNIPYRVIALCSGDLGFSSAKTYDIEVWFPSENKYREISSCSNFEDFQARRAGIRFRRDAGSKPEFVHTLNGSGLAVGRTFAAILENFQQIDGSVIIPEKLRKYMQVSAITSR